MNDHLEKLGLRAVACAGWRWEDGMKAIVPSSHEGGTGYTHRLAEGEAERHINVGYPDLSDMATLGCLLALVREAWEVPDLAAIRSTFKDGSVVWSIPMTAAFKVELGLTGEYLGGATEAEALVAALEAADSPSILNLARRAVACKKWRWMNGMQIGTTEHMLSLDAKGGIPTHYGVGRILGITSGQPDVRDGTPIVRMYSNWTVAHREDGPLPDLTDPATLGCLLHLVREAWSDPMATLFAWTSQDNPDASWSMSLNPPGRTPDESHEYWGDTEAEVLVAALEAAP
jgi:hypothetical protein